VPATGELFLDGKPVGRGSYAAPIEPGQHSVEASAPGFHTQRTSVTIERGKALPLALTLLEDKPAVAPKPHLRDDDDEPRLPREAREDRFRGTYGRLSFSFLYPLVGSVGPHEMAPDNSGDPGSRSRVDYLGGAATLRVGYNFDPFGLEFVGSFLRAQYVHELTFNDYTETLSFASMGGFGGLGARITSRDDTVRVSAGLSLGAVFRWTQLNDKWTPTKDTTVTGPTNDASVMQIEPALGFDAELMIGSTPGTRFVFGVETWVELLGRTTVQYDSARTFPLRALSSGPYTVSNGAVFYIGPHLGLQFGR
jgi:hypothetical protein